eukprot:TRINITY_DN34385_c0_g1_i1.p1 TRINITY_DN34385_c0_g1~~TRINITY_DN34385_c0_g1_i1.p1  ORF type:complete len:577 (+),score=128.45 TRINITY_DN34385_c0_g1_i1:91-1821(+)
MTSLFAVLLASFIAEPLAGAAAAADAAAGHGSVRGSAGVSETGAFSIHRGGVGARGRRERVSSSLMRRDRDLKASLLLEAASHDVQPDNTSISNTTLNATTVAPTVASTTTAVANTSSTPTATMTSNTTSIAATNAPTVATTATAVTNTSSTSTTTMTTTPTTVTTVTSKKALSCDGNCSNPFVPEAYTCRKQVDHLTSQGIKVSNAVKTVNRFCEETCECNVLEYLEEKNDEETANKTKQKAAAQAHGSTGTTRRGSVVVQGDCITDPSGLVAVISKLNNVSEDKVKLAMSNILGCDQHEKNSHALVSNFSEKATMANPAGLLALSAILDNGQKEVDAEDSTNESVREGGGLGDGGGTGDHDRRGAEQFRRRTDSAAMGSNPPFASVVELGTRDGHRRAGTHARAMHRGEVDDGDNVAVASAAARDNTAKEVEETAAHQAIMAANGNEMGGGAVAASVVLASTAMQQGDSTTTKPPTKIVHVEYTVNATTGDGKDEVQTMPEAKLTNAIAKQISNETEISVIGRHTNNNETMRIALENMKSGACGVRTLHSPLRWLLLLVSVLLGSPLLTLLSIV